MKANNGASIDDEPVTIQTLNFSSVFIGAWLATVSAPYPQRLRNSLCRVGIGSKYLHRRASQFLADRVYAKAPLTKNFRGHAFFFAKDAQQQMFGSNVPVIQTLGLFGCIGQNASALI